jgi:multidrug efflux pump subunit AcrA (membrane-fusion protein)
MTKKPRTARTRRAFLATAAGARLSVCLSLALILGLTGCGSPPAKPIASQPYVQTTVAREGVVRPNIILAGIVAPYENVAIQSSLVEPALTVNVQEGDQVSKGQVLAQLDTSDLEAALQAALATAASNHASTSHAIYQGNLNIAQGSDQFLSAQTAVRQATANLARDRTDLTRYQSLLAQGYIAEQTVAQQRTLVQNDEAALAAAQATLSGAQSAVRANGTSLGSSGLQASSVAQSAALEKVALAQAQQDRVQIAKATIFSPIDGVVVNRNLNPGEYPGTRQLFTLQQVDSVYAILRGSSAQVAHVIKGGAATIVTPDAPDSRYVGTVVGVLNQISPGSTNFQVKVLVQNPRQTLRPGGVVSGRLTAPPVRGIRIPETAFTDDNHTSILVVNSTNIVSTAKVAELATDGTTTIVTGLRPGVRVVTDGQTGIGDGEKVSVR